LKEKESSSFYEIAVKFLMKNIEKEALLLRLTKQGFFLIPLILILPNYYGIFDVWISFPIADLLSIILISRYLNKEVKRNLKTAS
jgi:Na+-driven multidrug efflux pump